MSKVYDLIVIGAGPAGLSAALYAGRSKLSTLVLEKSKTGGQIVITHEVANYPGSVREATGPSLIGRMVEQVVEFGAEIQADNVIDVDFSGDIKIVKGDGSKPGQERYKGIPPWPVRHHAETSQSHSMISPMTIEHVFTAAGCQGDFQGPLHGFRAAVGKEGHFKWSSDQPDQFFCQITHMRVGAQTINLKQLLL